MKLTNVYTRVWDYHPHLTYPPSIGVSILFTHPPFFRFGIDGLISFRLLLLLLRINVRGFVNVITYLALAVRVNALNRYSLFVGYCIVLS